MVFAVLEHSVLEREYAPLFQADFALLLLREGGGRSLFNFEYKFYVYLITVAPIPTTGPVFLWLESRQRDSQLLRLS